MYFIYITGEGFVRTDGAFINNPSFAHSFHTEQDALVFMSSNLDIPKGFDILRIEWI